MTIEQLTEKLKTFNKNSTVECTLWGNTYSGVPVMGELEEEYIITKEYIGLEYPVVQFGKRKEQQTTIEM